MRTIQPWASGGVGTKTNPNEIGVTTIGTGVAGRIDATTARDTMTGIVTVMAGGTTGTTGTTEVDTDETVGQGPGLRGGHDLEIGITEDGEGLGRE